MTRDTVAATSIDEALAGAQDGFAVVPWDVLGDAGEQRLAEQGVTVRCLRAGSDLPSPGQTDGLDAVVARAY